MTLLTTDRMSRYCCVSFIFICKVFPFERLEGDAYTLLSSSESSIPTYRLKCRRLGDPTPQITGARESGGADLMPRILNLSFLQAFGSLPACGVSGPALDVFTRRSFRFFSRQLVFRTDTGASERRREQLTLHKREPCSRQDLLSVFVHFFPIQALTGVKNK